MPEDNGSAGTSHAPQTLRTLAFSGGYLVRWALYAVLIGGVVGSLSFLFEWTLKEMRELISHTWLWGLPIAGGLMTSVFIKWDPRTASDGIQHYIDGVRGERKGLGILLVPVKYLASLFTLTTGGSGGRVGPVVLMGGCFGSWASRLSGRHRQRDYGTATMCGAAAAIGALLGTPLGGGIFAAEVLSPSGIRYRGIFPAILSSTMGYVMRTHFFPKVWDFSVPRYSFKMSEIVPVFAAALLAGLVGLAFTLLYQVSVKKMQAVRHRVWIVPAVGAALVVGFGWSTVFLGGAEGTEIMGIGVGLFIRMMQTPLTLRLALTLLVFKTLSTISTVASGGSGGLFYPALLIGGLVGSVLSQIVDASYALHLALLSAAIGASLASVVNVPIAAAVMMLEMFGTGLGVPIIIGATAGFMIGRPGVVYHYGRREEHVDEVTEA